MTKEPRQELTEGSMTVATIERQPPKSLNRKNTDPKKPEPKINLPRIHRRTITQDLERLNASSPPTAGPKAIGW
jgi:hypothetical protein